MERKHYTKQEIQVSFDALYLGLQLVSRYPYAEIEQLSELTSFNGVCACHHVHREMIEEGDEMLTPRLP